MNRSLLTPPWLALHGLFLTATIATGFLAWWQWERAHDAGGSPQNLGYALMWPLFGVFTVFLWRHLVRTAAQATDQAGASAAVDQESEVPVETRRRPLVPPPAPPVSAEDDPELAAYNEYLAELNRAEPS